MGSGTEATNDVAFFVTRIDKPGSPVRDRTDHVGKYILEPPLTRHGLSLLRADQDPSPLKITEKIVNNILRARVVIVDATGGNPNVFYELGLAHAFQKTVIMLIDSTDEIPFDVSDYTFIAIGDKGKIGAEEAEIAARTFDQSLDVVLADGFSPSSPVTAADAIAVLQKSDKPEQQVLVELLKRLDSMESDIRRISKGPSTATPPKSGLNVRKTTNGFVIGDSGDQIYGVTDDELLDVVDLVETPHHVGGWLQNELVKDGWDMSDIDSQELRRAAFAMMAIVR